MRFVLPDSPDGTIRVRGDAVLTLAGLDVATDSDPAQVVRDRELRVRASVADRLGWLTSTPSAELRKVTAALTIPLGGGADQSGTGQVVLHDARVLGLSWEQLVIGPDASPLVPEARALLAIAVQRLTDAAAGASASAFAALLESLGLIAGGGAAFDAIDQLVRDPGGLVRARFAAALPDLCRGGRRRPRECPAWSTSPPAHGPSRRHGRRRTVRLVGRRDRRPDRAQQARSGSARPDPRGPTGSLRLLVDLAPFAARIRWQRPGGGTDVRRAVACPRRRRHRPGARPRGPESRRPSGCRDPA